MTEAFHIILLVALIIDIIIGIWDIHSTDKETKDLEKTRQELKKPFVIEVTKVPSEEEEVNR